MERIPTLFRLIIDGRTASLKEEKAVETLSKIGKFTQLTYTYGKWDTPVFYVEKDAASDHYAVAKINTLEDNPDKFIEFVLFDGDHKEFSRTFYSLILERYARRRCMDMVMYEKDKVALLLNGYSSKKTGGQETGSFVAIFSKGTVVTTNLKFEENRYVEDGSIKYNSRTKELAALALGQNVEFYGGYTFAGAVFTPSIVVLDPTNGKIIRQTAVSLTNEVDQTIQDIFNNKTPYRLVPQNFLINDDGSYTVLCEDLAHFIPQKSGYISTSTVSVLMSRYTHDLQLKESFLIPKSHWLERLMLAPFYVRDWGKKTIPFGHSNPFKSFAYLNASSGNYMLFNDLEDNAQTV